MNTPPQPSIVRDPLDLLADRFAAQVRERTGFQGPHPDQCPAGAGFEFGRGAIQYAVVINPPGSVVIRVKNGTELLVGHSDLTVAGKSQGPAESSTEAGTR